jgi:acetyl-CoA/propionyl-CoA carboxylase biotin carboxyl carrier protein
MPGAVVAILVNDGGEVGEGAAIIVVEAMKMEHVLRATTAGRVALQVTVGSQVTRDQLLATVLPIAVPIAVPTELPMGALPVAE